MELTEAKKIADSIVEVLSPETIRIDIAGSVRRMVKYPGDIEIVCLPKQEQANQGILFAEPVMVRSKKFCKLVNNLGRIIKGNISTGRYCQFQLQDITLDLFMPQGFDYYRQLVIRTGDADFSNKVAKRWVELGWVGTEHGLRRREECIKSINKWTCIAVGPTLPPVWQSEREFFAWIGLEYTEPEKRSM